MPNDSDGGANAPPDSATNPPAAGRNQGNGGRGARNRRWNQNRRNQTRGGRFQERFDGREPSLKGFVYDLPTDYNQDQYLRTTKEIKNYVGRTFKSYTGELMMAIDELVLEDPDEPAMPDDNASRAQFEIWKLDRKEWHDMMKVFEDFRAGLFNIVMGQCTEGLEQKIRSHEDFEEAEQDGIALLLIVRSITHAFEDRTNRAHQIVKLKNKLKGFQQGSLPLIHYHDQFLSRVEALKHLGATFYEQAVVEQVMTERLEEDSDEEDEDNVPTDEDREKAAEMSIAIMFLEGAHNRYKDYVSKLSNDFLQGEDKYPKTLQEAYLMLDRWEGVPNRYNVRNIGNDGIAFAQPSTDVANRRPDITCYNCQQTGHFANQCPNRESGNGNNNDNEDGVNAFMCVLGGDDGDQDGFTFSQGEESPIPDTWMLLDNQSTDDIFKNGALLKNIRKVDQVKRIWCNAGVATTNQVGDLLGYGTVWYHPKGIANIVSLSRAVKAGYHVQFDSEKGNRFVVTKPSGKVFVFNQAGNGLFYLDTQNDDGHAMDGAALTVATVDSNKLGYSNADYLRAKTARDLQIRIGRPTTNDFKRIIDQNLLPNCPVTTADVMAAEHIFGPDIGSLKGKTVRRRPRQARTNDVVKIPLAVHERYREVTICGDVMYVNEQPMFTTISRNIRFGTSEALTSKGAKELLRAIDSVVKTYRQGGFVVRTMLLDNEFESLRGDLAARGIHLNGVAREEHVPEAERFVRTIKERTRATYSTLPFKRVPMRLIIEMVYDSVFWWNAFPKKNGVSDTLSPRTILTGRKVDYNRHCRYTFGEYVQVHEQHNNSVSVMRTTGALALRPTGNDQGNYYFFSLTTGRKVNRVHATKLPMPSEVIERVHYLADRQEADPELVFADRFTDMDEEHQDYEYDSDEDEDYDDLGDYSDSDYVIDDYDTDDGPWSESGSANDSSDTGDDESTTDEDDDSYEPREPTDSESSAGESVETSSDSNDEDSDGNDNGFNVVEDDNTEDEFMDASNDDEDLEEESTGVGPAVETAENTGVDSVETLPEAEVNEDMDARYGARTEQYDLRPRRERHVVPAKFREADDTGAVLTNTDNDEFAACMLSNCNGTTREVAEIRCDLMAGYVFGQSAAEDNEDKSMATAQMSMKRGLNIFKEKGVAAVRSEMEQLHTRKVMGARDAKQLTPEQKKEALAYLMFLKRKRCGKVKARGCADGRKQRKYTAKESSTSPTVSSEAVFLTAMMDAMEERDVAVVDIPGAFMQADMDELVFVRIVGKMAELLVDIDPEMYKPFVTYERGEMVIYVELFKALYGTIRAARLFWEKLSGELAKWGFTANPYDACVMNKMVNGKQCTVVWHVDDLKISHVDHKVVDRVIEQLEETFGEEAPLSKSRGKVHDYLGMTLDFREKGVLKVDMSDYIRAMIAEMPKDMLGRARTVAANHLFQTNEVDPVLLSEEKKEVFHHMVMQLMYLSQRGRPDLRTAVSFLCTRVNKPDNDDYKKLRRVMQYLQATVNLPLRLSCDGSGIVRWWVDASYAVHPNMRGHTGACMSMGGGACYSMSSKQKLNGRSSTETELYGVHDTLPQALWYRHFILAQQYKIIDVILYQDNMSAMLLEQNGRMSSTKRTKHIDVRYYYVKDRIAAGDVRLEHCPTKEMWADYFTKPLQGALFYKLRDLIMNIDSSSEYHSSHRSVLTDDASTRKTKADAVTKTPSKDTEDKIEVGKDTTERVGSYRDAVLKNISSKEVNGMSG